MNKSILLLTLFLFCTPVEKYNKIIVEYVDFEILTPIHIDCNNFNSYFKENMVRKEIKSKDELFEISTIIKKMQSDTAGYKPDIRLKMVLFSDNKIDTLCMSDIGVVFNKESMLVPNKLLEFVQKIKTTK